MFELATMKIIISLLITLFAFSIQADEIYQQSAVDLCQNIKQKSYQTKCLKQVKTHTFNETALSYCGNIGSWNKIKTCLELIKNNSYQESPLKLCHSAKYFNNDFKACMKEAANKSYVSDIEVKLCQQQKSFNKQVKCLQAASSKPYVAAVEMEKSSDTEALASLQGDIKKAYELLRNNKTADATILLHDLVTSFKK